MEISSIKEAYGEALVAAGDIDKRIVVLEADLGKSTMSRLFERAHPDRFFEMGIAEQNMSGVAAGLAITGKKPVINSFAMFITGRNYDQIRQSIALPKLPVIIGGASAGLSDFSDGSTHQSLEDISLMRTLPNMTVVVPCDEYQMRKTVQEVLKLDSPAYIRINRNPVPIITKPDDDFKIGDLYMMREGTDYAVMSNGYMLHIALEAADKLSEKGVSARVINVPTVKPVNIPQLKQLVNDVKGIVVLDEHSKYGGLYSTIAEILIENAEIPVRYVSVEDVFGTSAEDYHKLLMHMGLTSDHVVEKIMSFDSIN